MNKAQAYIDNFLHCFRMEGRVILNLNPLKKYLFDEHYDNPVEFLLKRNRKNIEHGATLSVFVMAFEIIFMTIAINSFLSNANHSFHYFRYILMYLVMILVNFGFLIFAKKVNLTDPSEKALKYVNRGILLYSILLAFWGTIISLMDQALYSNLNAFLVNLMVVSTLFYYKRKTMFYIYLLSVFPLFFLLPFFQPSVNVLIGHYVNGSVIICFMWLASRLIYNGFVQNHNTNCELQAAADKLAKTASVDALTGLSNRYGLTAYLSNLSEAGTYSSRLIGIIMMDIDSFKEYNDVHGHIEGDKVLREIGKVLNEETRGSENLAVRFGGEEFLLLYEDKNVSEIYSLAEKIRLKINSLSPASNNEVIKEPITISAGAVSLEIFSPQFIWTAIEKADKLLYVSKTTGKNKVTVA